MSYNKNSILHKETIFKSFCEKHIFHILLHNTKCKKVKIRIDSSIQICHVLGVYRKCRKVKIRIDISIQICHVLGGVMHQV